jgi:tRNA(Ile)-lysidine synthase
MEELIPSTIKKFLEKNYTPGRALLLGFSGGPDSLALLHLLLEWRSSLSLNLHVAHIDHRWRPESSSQAMKLQEVIEALGLPFHLHVSEIGEAGEESARAERLRVFEGLYRKWECQALLLAHQADDQAETVLKRIFEGASLLSVGGMRPISSLFDMQVWRPLLGVSKKALLALLKKKGIEAIVDDYTNRDPKFLRARMRLELLPQLERSFGKGLSSHLCRWGEMGHELQDYFQRKNPLVALPIQRGPFGLYIDFNPYDPLDPLELKIFVKSFLEREGIKLSRASLEMIQSLVLAKKADRRVIYENKEVILDRGYLFIIEKQMPSFIFETPLKKQEVLEEAGWSWTISCEKGDGSPVEGGWRALWKGKAQVVLSQGDHRVISSLKYPLIKKRWTDHKIPAFLRAVSPLILCQEGDVHEFLVEKRKKSSSSELLVSVEIGVKC